MGVMSIATRRSLNGRKAAATRRFSAVRLLLAVVLSLVSVPGGCARFAPPVYAAPVAASPERLNLALSDAVVWREQDEICYKTQLTVVGIESLFGYQIQIEAEDLSRVQITNRLDGMCTQPVIKDDGLYLAAITSTPRSGDVLVCEIICRYPLGWRSSPGSVVVRTFKAVTSINSEQIVVSGPDPAAVSLKLPIIGHLQILISAPADGINLTCLLVATLVLVLAAMALAHARRRRESRRRHARQKSTD